MRPRLPAGSRMRAATPDDIPAVVAVAKACDLEDIGEFDVWESGLHDEWVRPRFDPSTDAWVVTEPGGQVVAATYTWDEEPHTLFDSAGWVHPAYRRRGIGTALVLAVEHRAVRDIAKVPAGSAPRVLQSYDADASGAFDPDVSGARVLLEGLGYSAEREYLHMEIDVPEGFDPVAPPAGIEIRQRVETDDRDIVAVMADAFDDPWDYEEARQEVAVSQTYDQSLWLIALDRDEAVGALFGYLANGRGQISALAVREAWRRRGIASALLGAAFAMFSDRRGRQREAERRSGQPHACRAPLRTSGDAPAAQIAGGGEDHDRIAGRFDAGVVTESMGRDPLRYALGTLAVAILVACGVHPTGRVAVTEFSAIWAGVDHTCALTRAGAAECWGQNDAGQSQSQPGPYTQLSAGGLHNCALTTSGGADCWGANEYGESTDHAGPYTQVVAGWMHTCGLTPEGAADCWGRNDSGQARDQPGPYTELTISGSHNCGLTPAGVADCWGRNNVGLAEDHRGPYEQVSAGDGHNCALTTSGAADCWGLPDDGQAQDRPGPFTQLSAGDHHNCALRPDGSVECWGRNDFGQAADQPGPYVEVSAGSYHTCAITAAGDVDCWGDNRDGQLG